MSHFEGLYVFLFKHAWRSHAVLTPGRRSKRYWSPAYGEKKGGRKSVLVPSAWHSFGFKVYVSGVDLVDRELIKEEHETTISTSDHKTRDDRNEVNSGIAVVKIIP
jgi:hypothetical protein